MSTPRDPTDEAARLAENVLDEINNDSVAAREDAQRQQERLEAGGPRRTAALAVLSLAFVALTALNLTGNGPFSIDVPELSPQERRQAMRQDVNDVVDELEFYHEEFGRFPDALGNLVLDEASWDYRRVANDRYRIELREQRTTVSYDSVDDPDEVFADLRETAREEMQ